MGESLLQRAVRTALEAQCQPIVVVLGANEAIIRPEVSLFPIQVVYNPVWAEGMSSSIRTGVQHLLNHSPTIQATILMLCDQPLVTPALLNQLIATYQTAHLPIVACQYGGQLGVPALFDKTMFTQLLALQGPEGAKSIIQQYTQVGSQVDFPEGILDIDLPNDYLKVQEWLAHANKRDPELPETLLSPPQAPE